MATRRRNVMGFDDDSVIVEKSYPTEKVEVVEKRKSFKSARETKEINVDDVMDTFAGYMAARFGVNKSGEPNGECVICGKSTQYQHRKMCVDCLEKYSVEDILNKSKTAVENGETTFTLNVINNE